MRLDIHLFKSICRPSWSYTLYVDIYIKDTTCVNFGWEHSNLSKVKLLTDGYGIVSCMSCVVRHVPITRMTESLHQHQHRHVQAPSPDDVEASRLLDPLLTWKLSGSDTWNDASAQKEQQKCQRRAEFSLTRHNIFIVIHITSSPKTLHKSVG